MRHIQKQFLMQAAIVAPGLIMNSDEQDHLRLAPQLLDALYYLQAFFESSHNQS